MTREPDEKTAGYDLLAGELVKRDAEIERLSEIETLYKAGCEQWRPVYKVVLDERDALRAEVERLRALTSTGPGAQAISREPETWPASLAHARETIIELRADNARLRADLQRIADDGKNCTDYCRRHARAALEPKP